MGLLSFLFGTSGTSATTSKYASHSDVLEAIAKEVAPVALKQISKSIESINLDCTYCRLGYGSLRLDNQPEGAYYTASKYSQYSWEWSDFGMQDVPEEDAKAFFGAFCPYLKKHLQARLKDYFPSAFGVYTTQTQYNVAPLRDIDDYGEDVIKITVDGIKKPEPQKPQYNAW